MRKTSLAFLREVPQAPSHKEALVSGMPPSTGVFANPIRYHQTVACEGQPVELAIRSFGIRGCLFEEDLITGAADAIRAIFVGLFGRFGKTNELHAFTRLLAAALTEPVGRVLSPLAKFTKSFPRAGTEVAVLYLSAFRNAKSPQRGVRSRPAEALLRDLINDHMENALVAACSSYMRSLMASRPRSSASALTERTMSMIAATPADPFRTLFSLLLRRRATSTESRILERLGAVQIHHGSAGSNMVARYLASLHTRCTSDIFTAAHMTLDCARHFGAITDLTEFVQELEHTSPKRWDRLIRTRAVAGNLPTFGHPEIAAAGRDNRIEVDPRPAIYLSSLFDAMDSGEVKLSDSARRSVALTQRMYQIAFVEGIEKPGRTGRLRIAPNTDFGAWIVQECLGVDRSDRTLLSYVFRGFGWMMDVREQLQQPIIRPVIPPDPAIVPPMAKDGIVSGVVRSVHDRLCSADAWGR
jgi:citrate synthase